MAVILAHPAASAPLARRPGRAARDIPLPPPRSLAAPSRRRRSLLLLGLVPLLLANASWDAVTFLGGPGSVNTGDHAHFAPAAAHPSASACA